MSRPENLPSIGDANQVGIWDAPEFTDEDIEVAKTLGKRPPKAPRPRPERGQVNYTGRGVIGRLLEQDGLLGEQVEPGVWSMTCPNASQHSSGEPFDSTCRYYEPTTWGHYLGTIDCLHTSAGHNLWGSKEWLGGWTQDRIDDARKVEGLPEFRRRQPAPQRNVASASIEPSMPEDDLWEGEALDENENDDAFSSDPTEHDPNWGGLTDYGNAERFVAMHGKNVRYCPAKKKWYYWCGTHWELDEDGAAQRLMKRTVRSLYKVASDCPDRNKGKDYAAWAYKSEAAPRINAALFLAQSELGIPVSVDQFDSDPWLFNCQNGILDLQTGKLGKHDRKQMMTRISKAKYDPDADLTVWLQYLDSATFSDTGLQQYLQRVVGYSATAFTTEKCFFFFYGPPDSSKSTFLKVIANMFGSYAANVASSTWLVQNNVGGNRGDIVRLTGVRLVTSSELKKGAKLDEELMKSVTGSCDTLTYAAKYENEVEIMPHFSLFWAANDPPVIRDEDAAMWRRVRRVPFSHTIPLERQNPKLVEQMARPAMLSAILKWTLTGCLEWKRLGNLGTCDAVAESSASYKNEMDRYADFEANYLEFFGSYRVPSAELREQYETWCSDRGIRRPLTVQEFSKKLLEKGCETHKGDHGRRFWLGVRLNTSGGVGGAGSEFPQSVSYQNLMGDFRENAYQRHLRHLDSPDDVMTDQPSFSKEELDKL
jgi:putative DNA primase/helicase